MYGVYDLILHNYGPDNYNGSVHIEVPDTMTASDIDELIRQISMKVASDLGVFLTAVSVYSRNTTSPQVSAMRAKVEDVVAQHKNLLGIHGFYVNPEEKTLRFDMVISFDEPDRAALFNQVTAEVCSLFPDFAFTTTMDSDFSE